MFKKIFSFIKHYFCRKQPVYIIKISSPKAKFNTPYDVIRFAKNKNKNKWKHRFTSVTQSDLIGAYLTPTK